MEENDQRQEIEGEVLLPGGQDSGRQIEIQFQLLLHKGAGQPFGEGMGKGKVLHEGAGQPIGERLGESPGDSREEDQHCCH